MKYASAGGRSRISTRDNVSGPFITVERMPEDVTLTQLEWTDIVDRAIESQEFLDAWKEVGDFGIGSLATFETIVKLLQESPYHREKIANHVKIIAAAAPRSAKGKLTDQFVQISVTTLMTACAAYMIIGIMTGIVSVISSSPDEPR
jgi:hypothetical protein